MIGANDGSESLPERHEPLQPESLLEARMPFVPMPTDRMWPLRLHDAKVHAEAQEALPQIINALSQPVAAVSPEDVRAIFAQNPYDRQRPWTSSGDDEQLSYVAQGYLGPEDERGGHDIFYGLQYDFDENGRVTRAAMVQDDRPGVSDLFNHQVLFEYDQNGHLVQQTTAAGLGGNYTDTFHYSTDPMSGSIVPVEMTRTLLVHRADGSVGESLPMMVDLAHYDEWLATNPNGFHAIEQEAFRPHDLEAGDFRVDEYRRGIRFASPGELEQALIMYGNGTYATPGGQTAFEHNVDAFATSGGSWAAELFAEATTSGDMHAFVKGRITNAVRENWGWAQRPWRRSGTERNTHFNFDYDGLGNFHKTHGEISVGKSHVDLELRAAYVGDAVEDQLAAALGKQRGLRRMTLSVPVNQSDREGYFYVNVAEACELLGVPATNATIERYLDDAIMPGQTDSTRFDRDQPPLWADETHGVAVNFAPRLEDYDTRTDLRDMFRRDGATIWGPLPRDVLRVDPNKVYDPEFRIVVTPAGNPFDPEVMRQADEVMHGYVSRIGQAPQPTA
ncbi:MAG: hypothetical protein KIH63_003240 [Candidatus Saccharibacteria bacterium]|nr:hypothetical protein [Candidatus Saccharibacteria bacterium]